MAVGVIWLQQFNPQQKLFSLSHASWANIAEYFQGRLIDSCLLSLKKKFELLIYR